MVEIKVLECDDSRIRVHVKGIHRSYANAIRRFAINEVPVMAIDDIVILENSSVLYDELIAHRLGLIPLKTDLSRHVLPERCDCKSALGCQKCRVLLVLDAEASVGVTTVYSGHLRSEDEFVKPVSDRVPIVELAPGQRVKLESYARLGRGREHAKWQAASASVLTPVDDKEDESTLYIESAGSIPAPEIFVKAVEVLKEKLEELGEKVEGL